MRVLLRVQAEPLIALGEIFETRIVPGRPSWISVGFSLVFHLIAAACLALIHIPANPPKSREKQLSSTEIRIGDKIYYFARLAPPERRPEPSRGALAGKQKIARESPPRLEPRQQGARPFVPPEIRREAAAPQTLIQPSSPPEIQPPELTLPSLRVWTAQIPKIPKTFVMPGRAANVIPETQPLPAPPNLNLISASPAPASTNPALAIPLAPPPIEVPDIQSSAMQSALPGDPVNILVVTGNPVVPASKLVVPAGNSIGFGGNDPAGRSANSTGSGLGNAGPIYIGEQGLGSAKGSGIAANGPDGVSGSGAGARGGSPINTVVVTPPPGGSFDAVVIQSSALDLFPGRKSLLSGRPIYTVYFVLGTAKDWTFYFCVPQDSSGRNAQAPVITLSSVAPVAAPYPLHMVRPLVAMPSYQKYLLVHGFVTDRGRVERLRIVDPGSQQVDDAVLASLIEWEFRPATRDGQPTAIEFLLAIPQAGLGL